MIVHPTVKAQLQAPSSLYLKKIKDAFSSFFLFFFFAGSILQYTKGPRPSSSSWNHVPPPLGYSQRRKIVGNAPLSNLVSKTTSSKRDTIGDARIPSQPDAHQIATTAQSHRIFCDAFKPKYKVFQMVQEVNWHIHTFGCHQECPPHNLYIFRTKKQRTPTKLIKQRTQFS